MADHLIFSLQAPPFLIFPSSLHRPWGFFRRLPGGVRFSVTEFRLSSQLQLANSISPSKFSASSSSPCPPENSAPEKFDLVSSTRKLCFIFFSFVFSSSLKLVLCLQQSFVLYLFPLIFEVCKASNTRLSQILRRFEYQISNLFKMSDDGFRC